MPLHWYTARLDTSSLPNDDAAGVTEPGRHVNATHVDVTHVDVTHVDVTRRDVLVTLCDRRGVPNPSDNACWTAVSVLENFYDHPPREETVDPGLTLVDALVQALFMARYYPVHEQPATIASSGTAVAVEAENESMGGSSATPGDRLTIIVAVVKQGTLYVANSGRHCAYVWRNGELVALEVDRPSSPEIRHTHYELARKDRVLLCTEGFHQNVPTETIAHILKTEPAPDRAVAALMDAAAKSRPADTAAHVSVAVLDYNPLLRGVALPIAMTATIFAVVVFAVIALLIGNRLSSVGDTQALASSVVSATEVLAETNTLTPAPSPSHTPAVTQVPIAGPDVVTATATVRPQPTSTATPTPEPTATGTETPTSTIVPPTPVPPTDTPVPPVEVLPTETPVPPAEVLPTETPTPPAAEPPIETPVPPAEVPPTETPVLADAAPPAETETPVPPTETPGT